MALRLGCLGHRLLYTAIMLNRLRIVLVCLLALALPVQGFAAATMLFCAGGHHHGAVARGAVSEMGGTREHAAEAGHAHHHASGVDLHSHGQSVAKLDGKCSACSACCTAVVLPTTLVAFVPVKVRSPLVAIVPSASAGFLTDGQDRPPRPFLA